MALVMRGWSKTASTALKLATAERIIGYQFNSVDRLYEALDQTQRRISLPSGKTRAKPRNSRLALVGDAIANLRMARMWYDKSSLTGVEFSKIRVATLSNERLAEVGFKLGLDECAISKEITKEYDMATTIEALIAAVDEDGASQQQVSKLCTRFGLEHKLVEPAGRSWIWEMVSSKLDLPDKFFIGHHLELQECIFETQLRRLRPPKKKQIWLWGRAERLWGRAERLCGRAERFWGRAKRLWQPRKVTKEELCHQKEAKRQKKAKRLASQLATRPPGSVVPLARRSQSAATKATGPPSDESTSKIKLLVEDSVGHHEENEKIAAPEETTEDGGKVAASGKTTDTENLAERHDVTKSSTSKTPTSPKPTRRQPRPVLLEEATPASDAEPAETGSQGSTTASNNEAEPPPSGVAATGAEEHVEHPADEASDFNPAGETTEDVSKASKAHLERQEVRLFKLAQRLRLAIRELKKAGDKLTDQDREKMKILENQRKVIVDRRSLVILNLKSRTDL